MECEKRRNGRLIVSTDGAGQYGQHSMLRASGSGNWDIDCVAVTGRGEADASVKGRGSTSTDMLFVRDVSTAACTYQTGASPVTLKLMEEGLTCPFGAFESGICQTILPAETSGTLQFSVK